MLTSLFASLPPLPEMRLTLCRRLSRQSSTCTTKASYTEVSLPRVSPRLASRNSGRPRIPFAHAPFSLDLIPPYFQISSQRISFSETRRKSRTCSLQTLDSVGWWTMILSQSSRRRVVLRATWLRRSSRRGERGGGGDKVDSPVKRCPSC